MNERLVGIFSLFVAEFGASAVMVFPALGTPVLLSNRIDFGATHFQWLLLFWAMLACGASFSSPRMLRIRQQRNTKMRFLAVIWCIDLVVDNALSAYLSFQNPAALPHTLLYEMLPRTLAATALFWASVALGERIALKRQSHVTPPPLFGRD